MSVAGVAHPVERHLAKVEVASSSLVTRSIKTPIALQSEFFVKCALWHVKLRFACEAGKQ